MARGDVVNDVQSIAASGNLDFQPAVGVEVNIEDAFSDTGVRVSQFDGTEEAVINLWRSLTSASRAGLLMSLILDASNAKGDKSTSGQGHVMINNTDRIRITNLSASTNLVGYTGVQSK